MHNLILCTISVTSLCYSCFDLEQVCILSLILVFWCHSCLTILTILTSSGFLFVKNPWGNQQSFQQHYLANQNILLVAKADLCELEYEHPKDARQKSQHMEHRLVSSRECSDSSHNRQA